MNVETTEKLLRAHPFASDLTNEQVAFMAGCMRNLRYPAGSYLFREGQPANEFVLLRSGVVSLEVRKPGGGILQLETVSSGDVLGWSVLFPPYVWHLDGRAVENTMALVFDGACLRRKIDEDVTFAYRITHRLLFEVHRRLERARLQQVDVYRSAIQ
jgi:CRP-like cAMP-binding protein